MLMDKLVTHLSSSNHRTETGLEDLSDEILPYCFH